MGKKTTVEVLVEGGKASAGPALGGTLGPLKVNIGQVISQLNEKTRDFAGMKVPAKVVVDNDTKDFTISIGTPPSSDLIKKEVNLEKGSGEPDKIKVAAVSIEQIVKVAKMKSSSLIVNNLKSAVKTIVGTCNSLGILVEGKNPKEVIREIDEGKYDSAINSGKTEPDAEKKKIFEAMTKDLQNKLKELQKQRAEAKAAADAAAAAAAQAAPPAAGVAPAAGAAKTAAVPGTPAPVAPKKEEKKEAAKK